MLASLLAAPTASSPYGTLQVRGFLTSCEGASYQLCTASRRQRPYCKDRWGPAWALGATTVARLRTLRTATSVARLRPRAGAGAARAAGSGHGAGDGRQARGAHPRGAHGHGADVARGTDGARDRCRLLARGRIPAHRRACGPVLLVACWCGREVACWRMRAPRRRAAVWAPRDPCFRPGRGMTGQWVELTKVRQCATPSRRLCLRWPGVDARGGCKCERGGRAHFATARAPLP